MEATTKGGVLLFTAGEIENRLLRSTNISSGICGVLGGMGGGLAQAYTTMGFCTFMKTVEITRLRDGIQKSTFSIAKDIIARDGISGMNRGVTAVALRQMTNWGSRIGISRMTESIIGYVKTPKNMRATFENQKNVDITKNVNNTRSSKLNTADRLIASVVGGILGCWNQPFEVIRVEMQRQANKIITSDSSGSVSRTNIGLFEAAKRIYGESGAMGFYRGVGPRVGLSVYLTVCMVFGGDQIKEYFASL